MPQERVGPGASEPSTKNLLTVSAGPLPPRSDTA